MQSLFFILFFSIFSSIYYGLHYYVYIRIVQGLALPGNITLFLKIFFLLSGASFIVGEFLSRRFNVTPVLYYGSVWLGVIAIAFSAFLLKDIAAFALHNTRQLTIITIIAALCASAFSYYNVARGDRVKSLELKIGKPSSKFSSLTIVQLTDIHLDDLVSRKWLENLVNKTNALKPDIIVVTGDLIDSRDASGRFSDILGKLQSKYGVYAVTGNHEFYVGLNYFDEIAKNSNMIPLRNTTTGAANDEIVIAGIDDTNGRYTNEKRQNLEHTLANCDFKKPVILLSHQPDLFDDSCKLGVDLQLSGHTHAGQIPPMDFITMFYFKYPYGLYRQAKSFLYTSSGTGIWGPPMRLFSRSEIVKIKLFFQK